MNKENSLGLLIRITLKFVAKNTNIIKVIQNFMAITLNFNHFSEKTCWKKLFHFQFELLFFDICCLFWYGRRSSPRRQLVTSMSTKKRSKLTIEYLSECLKVATSSRSGYFRIPCGAKKILGREEKTKFYPIWRKNLGKILLYYIFQFWVALETNCCIKMK